jgi:hypothetical protein
VEEENVNVFDAGVATLDYPDHVLLRAGGAEAGTWEAKGIGIPRIDPPAIPSLLSTTKVPSLAFERPRWEDFLSDLTRAPVSLSPGHARAIRQVWAELEVGIGPALPLPSVGPSDNEGLTLSWSTDDWYAEVSVYPDGRHDWFFRDHVLGSFDGTDAPARGGPSHRFHGLVSAALKG